MSDRTPAREHEQRAIRLAQAALDSTSYDTPEQRTRKATLSQTYATLALAATIREGREPEIKEPVPEDPAGRSEAVCHRQYNHGAHTYMVGRLPLRCPGRLS